MSSEIKAGDRVMIVWGCCARAREFIGYVTTSDHVHPVPLATLCKFCTGESTLPSAFFNESPERGYYPTAWLRKMPPDAEHIDEDVATPIESTTL